MGICIHKEPIEQINENRYTKKKNSDIENYFFTSNFNNSVSFFSFYKGNFNCGGNHNYILNSNENLLLWGDNSLNQISSEQNLRFSSEMKTFNTSKYIKKICLGFDHSILFYGI